LLNMVEENAAAQTRRAREANEGLLYERGLWGHSLQRLQRRGLDAQQLSETLRHVRVEPVLTAHPTEAKRLAVLEAHRALFRLLERRENPIWTAAEQEAIRDEIKATLERIWRTGEILLEKPAVADERRNVLHYLRHVFPTFCHISTCVCSRRGAPSDLTLRYQRSRGIVHNCISAHGSAEIATASVLSRHK
jgi:phosphoenolpyruvate carboxylase